MLLTNLSRLLEWLRFIVNHKSFSGRNFCALLYLRVLRGDIVVKMPTITFSLKDLCSLVGKELSINKIEDLASNAKGSFEGYDEYSDEVKIDFGDTNLPYLWSVEGFARFIRGFLGLQKGIAEIKSNESEYTIKVEKSVSNVREFISAFVAKNVEIDEYLLKQLIQLQEKLSENFGRKREKIAIGIYPLKKIKFPLTYKAVKPSTISFVPLDFKVSMRLDKILETHPKGKEYRKILQNKELFPILIDDKNAVLSFPPIVNSEFAGRLNIGDNEIFFEATGIETVSLLLVTNIFAQALFERGAKIYSVRIKYDSKIITTPLIKNEIMNLDKEKVKEILGVELSESKIKRLLEKVGYNYKQNNVIIPHYRGDIMHPVDIIEDIGISYGYDNIEEVPLTSYTIGSTNRLNNFIDKLREIIIGLGYNEIMSAVLSNKETLYNKMNIQDIGTIEIEHFMSETYSVVRTWLLPILLECLSKNKHIEQPHKIFEQGIVLVRKDEEISEYQRIAILTSHEKADFTEVKQVLDYIMRLLELKYDIEDVEHNSFIPGRCGRVIVNKKKIAYIGEIHPIVLSNFGIETPVSALEINVSELCRMERNLSSKYT